MGGFRPNLQRMLRIDARRLSGLVRRAVVVGALVWLPSGAAAQNSVVAAAQALQAAGELAQAARLLEAHLAEHPDDSEAGRALAQTLYWLHDVSGARRIYDASLVRHPNDTRLQMEYARMLAETGEPARARALLTPLRDIPGTRADALTLLGTLAYWQGDLTAAEALFSDALRASPEQPDARRMVQEIYTATAPWVRVSPALWHDDQPYTRGAVLVEAGWFATPLAPVRVRMQPVHFTNDAASTTIWNGDAEIGHFAPRLRLETMIAGGIVYRDLSGRRSTDWKGGASAGVRLPGQATLRARIDRAPYLATPVSLASNITTRTIAGELQWNHPRGWLAQAAWQRQRFPDDNAIRTVYGWVLAPVVRQPRVELHAGYAFAADDAEESRFGSAGYEPYYTPSQVVKHSLIGSVTARPASRVTLRTGGAYAVRATEDAPSLVTVGGRTQRVFAARELQAWDARSSVELTTTNAVTIGVSGQFGRGAFYEWAAGELSVTYRFMPRPRSQSEPR